MAKFKAGDVVELLYRFKGRYDTQCNWGVVDSDENYGEVYVVWDDGEQDYVEIERLKLKVDRAGGSRSLNNNNNDSSLNTSELDRLVIDEDKRKEIEAVIKQHKFQNKIFEEWGLGEVIEYGRGMTMLFWGPPGTGKTWAATCIAKAIGKELQIVTPSMIQTSEPGGANRAIEAAFASAGNKKVIFFDECDSLVSSRENLGMILGSEINTLLTSIEKFEGVCILCTNRIEELDKALERRISLILEFPEPDRKQREIIWSKILPPKMPLEKGITPKLLSEAELTGGQIKNIVLNAARKAVAENSPVVTKVHFHSAIQNIAASANKIGTSNRSKGIIPINTTSVAHSAMDKVKKMISSADKVLTPKSK